MSQAADTRLARIDAAIVVIWAGLSLFSRRLLGTFPIAAHPQEAMTAIVQLGPGKLIWLPLIFYAGLLPLAILLFHRIYVGRARRLVRLGSAAGALGFVLFAVGLSLNIVEATAAGAYLSGLQGGAGAGVSQQFALLWQADQIVSGAALVFLAAWMAAVSRAAQSAGFAAWPRWFSVGGLAAAAVTIVAGLWGVISQGALAAVDGGDSLILIHLWIGLSGTLLWQQYGAQQAKA